MSRFRVLLQCDPHVNLEKYAPLHNEIHVLPIPRDVIISEKQAFLPQTINLTGNGVNETDEIVPVFLSELQEDLHLDPHWVEDFAISNAQFEQNKLEIPETEEEEGYLLEISQNFVRLEAKSMHGIFNSFQTLYQIIITSPHTESNENQGIILPCVKITDWPVLKFRGLADDISRGQIPTIAGIKRRIRDLGHFKSNVYAIYMEDIFTCTKHPKIGENNGAFTASELQEIDAYAKAHFITFFPIFQTLGHYDNVLTIPEYSHLGEFPGSQSLRVANMETYAFLNDFIKELAPCFSSDYFHMGCDESFDLGLGQSKKLIREIGHDWALLAHYKKVYEMIKATGKNHVIMYHDGMWKYPLIRQKLPKDIIIMIWDYTAKTKFPLAQKVIEAGFPIILSSQNLGSTRHFPDYLYSSKNIINITESAKKLAKTSDKVVGVLNSTWGNQYYSNFRENDLYGIILASNAAWTEKPLTLQKILPEIASCLFGLKTPQDISMFVELFEDLSHMVLNYSLPIRRFQQPFFTFLYRHPFYTTYPPAWIQNPKSLLSNANAVLEKLQTIDENVTAGQDLIPFLHFSAEIGQLLGEKEAMVASVISLLNIYIQLPHIEIPFKVKEQTLDILFNFKTHTEQLLHDYESLWMQWSKPPHFEVTSERFRKLIEFCSQKMNQISHDIAFKDPILHSHYIWTPKSFDSSRTIYFRKQFSITSPIAKARLQAIIGNVGIIYINGQRVGQVSSRFSQSILKLQHNIETFDILPYLNEGNNVIAVQANNYLRSIGFLNLFMQIQVKKANGIVINEELITDNKWQYTLSVDENHDLFEDLAWTQLDFTLGSHVWHKVKDLGEPPAINFALYKPDLLAGDRSFPEEFFGFLSSFYVMARFTSSEKISRFLQRISKFIVQRIMQLK